MGSARALRRRRERERQKAAPRDSGRRGESWDGYAHWRHALRGLAAERGEWAGIPTPLEGERLVVEPSYPYAAALEALPTVSRHEPRDSEADQLDTTGWKIRGRFWSTHRRSWIVCIEKPDGKVTYGLDKGVHHLEQDLRTLGCADAWGIEQETKAMELLRTLVKPRAFKQYLMTGMFLETSRRSDVTYIFRRLKPTVAITPRGKDGAYGPMRILAALCLHPIAYYAGSWAGAMTPTDDVVAHLMLMRGDEPLFWRRAQQHPAWTPQAGL